MKWVGVCVVCDVGVQLAMISCCNVGTGGNGGSGFGWRVDGGSFFG